MMTSFDSSLGVPAGGELLTLEDQQAMIATMADNLAAVQGGAVLYKTNIVWALDYAALDIAYGIKFGTSHGNHAAGCVGAEVAAGAYETYAIAVDPNEEHADRINNAEALDFFVTAACNALFTFDDVGHMVHPPSQFTEAEKLLFKKQPELQAVRAAAIAEQARWSLGGNVAGLACNAAEAVMSAQVAKNGDNSALAQANTGVEMGCSLVGIAIGFATGDPLMILASAFALVMQIIQLASEEESKPESVKVYENAYSAGESCLNDDEEILFTPLLFFYTGLHSNHPNGRYGYYVHGIEFGADFIHDVAHDHRTLSPQQTEAECEKFSNYLFPALAPAPSTK